MTTRRVLLACLAAASVLACAPATVLAQGAGDPPAEVGRLAEASGTVSFHGAGENQWEPATLNYPITNGNALWTEPRSHAAVDVGASRIYMDSSTELDVGSLDYRGFVASLPQGAAYVRLAQGSTPVEIDTPRGQVEMNQPGDYEIVAGDANSPTMVAVYNGSAQVVGQGVNLALGPNQGAQITGENGQFSTASGPAPQPDDFLRFVQSEEQPYQNQASQPPQQYGSPAMTGYEDLSRYGSWQPSPQYGQVWYPQVASGWAPYRYGHWAYVAPWGWTWVDDAPWGFAPFHYGRWVDDGGRWGWVPGAYQPQPIYAPALVSFFGDFGGVGIGLAIGSAVGWVPLAPDEVYYPGYRVSPTYLHRVNVTYVRNVTVINNYYYGQPHGDDYDHYKNHQHGATVVQSDVMLHSRSIGQAWKQQPQTNTSQAWQHAKSYGGQAPVKPTYATAGVTTTTAHQLGIAGNGTPNKPKSPGPQITLHKNTNGNGFAGNNGGQNNLQSTSHGNTTLGGTAGNNNTFKTTNPTVTSNGATGTNHANNNGQNGGAPGPTITTGHNTLSQPTFTTTNGKNNPPKNVAPGPTITTTHNNGLGNGQGNGQVNNGNANNNHQNNFYQGNSSAGGQGTTTHQTYTTTQSTHNNTATGGTTHAKITTPPKNYYQQPSNGQVHTNFNTTSHGNGGNQMNAGHNMNNGAPKLLTPPKAACKVGQKC